MPARIRSIVLAAVVPMLLAAGLAPPAAATGEPVLERLAGGLVQDAVATGVSLRPSGVAFDPAGNLLVVDAAASLVWRIGRDGRASVLAGDGMACIRRSGATLTGGRSECLDGSEGELEPALRTHFRQPSSLAVAPDGTAWIADVEAHVLRRLDPTARLVAVGAGSGERTYRPEEEDAPAFMASLNTPESLTFDPTGNLYVADVGNGRVRRIDPRGTISSVAGCRPDCAFSLRDRAPLDRTYLGRLTAIAVDGERLYIATATAVYVADEALNQWRRIAGDTFVASDRPGSGEGGEAGRAKFKEISALLAAPEGLYVLDRGWNRVALVEGPPSSTALLRHVAGCSCGGNGYGGDGGPATDAMFAFATGEAVRGWMARRSDGTLVLADIGNNRVRAVSPSGIVTTVAGNGSAAPAARRYLPYDLQPTAVLGGFTGDAATTASGAQLFGPVDVAVAPDNTVYVLDRHAHRVRRITADGTMTTVAGSGCAGRDCNPTATPLGDGGKATNAGLLGPSAIALDRTGTQLYIADYGRNRIRQVNLGESPVTVYPAAAAPIVIPPGTIATVAGSGANCVNVTFYCGDGRFATDASWSSITGLALDRGGNLYVADSRIQMIRRVDAATGTVSGIAGIPFHSYCEPTTQEQQPGLATLLCGPTDLTVGPDGGLYVVETGDYGFGSGYIGRQNAPRVRRIALDDALHRSTVVAGNGVTGSGGDGGRARDASFAFPRSIAFGPDGGLYIADAGNSRIRRVGTDGTVSTVAGSGEWFGNEVTGCGAAGEGGPAADAQLCVPMGLAFGSDGRLYVADQISNRVVAISGLAPEAAGRSRDPVRQRRGGQR